MIANGENGLSVRNKINNKLFNVTEAFNAAVQFDKNKFRAHTQAAAISYTLNTTDAVPGTIIRDRITTDGINTISFSGDFISIYGLPASGILPAGTYSIWMIIDDNNDVEVNIPAGLSDQSFDSILFSDNFNDNAIDTTKWTVVNSTLVAFTEASGQMELIINTGTVSGSNLNGRRSQVIDLTTIGSNILCVSGLINWEVGVTNAKGGLFMLAKDANNRIQFGPGSVDNGKIRLLALEGGVAEGALETTYDKNSYVKIVYNRSTHAISYQIWDGAAWDEVQTGNANLGDSVFFIMCGQNSNTTAVTQKTFFDNISITNFDFATQFPA